MGPVTDPLDADLVERASRGDGAAFDLLVERHIERAFAIAYRLLGNREDAEDVVQDAFVGALEAIGTFEAGRELAPWLNRIVVNRALNVRKSLARRATEPLADALAVGGGSPLRVAEQAELAELVRVAMAELPERQRDIVRLFELEGFTSAEIAAMLGIADGTVRWHLHEARQRLRQSLDLLVRSDG